MNPGREGSGGEGEADRRRVRVDQGNVSTVERWVKGTGWVNPCYEPLAGHCGPNTVCWQSGTRHLPRAPCPVPRAPCPLPPAPCPLPPAPCPQLLSRTALT